MNELIDHYRSLYGECSFTDDYYFDLYEQYVNSYGDSTIDEFLDHMKDITGDESYDGAFGDLANCFDLAIIDRVEDVNLEELECDYFICGDFVFNPYWENS